MDSAGNAVRIAQELGLDNISHAEDHNASLDAGQERILRTWICESRLYTES